MMFQAQQRRVRALLALGVPNLWRVLTYRLGVLSGLNPVRRMVASTPVGIFFRPSMPPLATPLLIASTAWRTRADYFGALPVPVALTPTDWHRNPLTGVSVARPERHWWQIPDFDSALGDIKAVWEASRFDWVLAFAQQAVAAEVNERAEHFARLQAWLADWCARNPPYRGANWKCGQEASIRVMHLIMTAHLLGQQARPEPALLDLVELHLQRIAPTLRYAVAQDNNHGTSEAAALFMGGAWLAQRRGSTRGDAWMRLGRRWLENRVQRLVAVDGSFSQHSVNYHRVMLDTLSMAEVWRRELGLPAFSAVFMARARAAALWLRAMTRPGGDAPNLGANDGARLLPLTDTGYRDFRPSVQLSCMLFAQARAWPGEGPWNQPLHWLRLTVPESVLPPTQSACFDDGGYACLRKGDAFAVLRYPRFRFRPGEADALHLDFWLGDDNLLRDAGSFSYNTSPDWQRYFPGTGAHNTVEFDGRDQMPRVSRFLFGDWLKTLGAPEFSTSTDSDTVCVAYRDALGAVHKRDVTLSANSLRVQDAVSGFKRQAILRWRLAPGDWQLAGNRVSNHQVVMMLDADVPITSLRIVEGWESRFYGARTPLPVLELKLNVSGRITTTIEWTS